MLPLKERSQRNRALYPHKSTSAEFASLFPA